MPEPDFTTLRAEAAGAIRLPEFDTIEKRSRAHRRQVPLRVGVLTVAAGVVAATVWAGGLHLGPAGEQAAAPSGTPGLSIGGAGTYLSTGPEVLAGDANQWYTHFGTCTSSTRCDRWIAGSSDAGRTWGKPHRVPENRFGRVLSLGGSSLLMISHNAAPPGEGVTTRSTSVMTSPPTGGPSTGPTGGPSTGPTGGPSAGPTGRPSAGPSAGPTGRPPGDPDPGMRMDVSLDGGATWRQTSIDPRPLAEMPAGGRALPCRDSRPGGDQCSVLVSDPRTGRISPLASQPPLEGGLPDPIGRPDHGIWVAGQESGTGRRAVAVSHDRGRTWQKHVFEQSMGTPGMKMLTYGPQVATVSDRTAYMTVNRGKFGEPLQEVLYRTDDGGRTWAEVNALNTTFPGWYPGRVVALPDGALLMRLTDPNSVTRYVLSRDRGATFQTATGVPQSIFDVETASGGDYFVLADQDPGKYGDEQLHGSTNGLTWEQRKLPKAP